MLADGAQATAEAFTDLQSNLTFFAATFQNFAMSLKDSDDTRIAELSSDIVSLKALIKQ